jgi:ABC-type multidrug transport system permease subunit
VLAYFIAALSPNMDVANAALPTYVVSLLFFSGFLIRYDDIPNYWKWYSFIDFLKYAWGALMKNQFAGERNIDVSFCTISAPRAGAMAGSNLAAAQLASPLLLLPQLQPAPNSSHRPRGRGAQPRAYHRAFEPPSLLLPPVLQFVPGQTVLDYYNLAGINRWGWLGIEACFTTGEPPPAHACCWALRYECT